MFTDLINKALQLVHPVLDELVLAATLDLLVRQRGNWNEGELFHQPFVKPVKMLVAPRDLDVIKLKINGRILSYIKE